MATGKSTGLDGLRTLFLAGVGAVSLTAEKTGEVVTRLAEQGQTVVSRGRDLNRELTRHVTDATHETRDAVLRTRLELMSEEERADFLASAERIARQISEEDAARREASGTGETAAPAPGAAADDAPREAGADGAVATSPAAPASEPTDGAPAGDAEGQGPSPR